MIRKDYQHNTREQAEGYLAAALEIVDAIGPPDDLRVAFFTKAVDLLASKQVVLEQPQMSGAILPQFRDGRG